MHISVIANTKKPTAKTLVAAAFQPKPSTHTAGWKYFGPARSLVTAHYRSGAASSDRVIPNGRSASVLTLSLGDKKRWHHRSLVLAVRRAIVIARHHRLPSVAFWVDDFNATDVALAVETIASQAIIADYEYTQYKRKPANGWPTIAKVEIVVPAGMLVTARRAAAVGVILGEETNHTRDLANMPGGDMTPTALAAAARAVAKEHRLECQILLPAQMKKMGMGGVLGVARGSIEEPRFIILSYHGAKKKTDQPVVLVGKGITFDTGGLNIKPDDSMYEMHMDMSGGAAVIHAIAAVARLKLPVNVIALVPAAENMPSGSGYRPGDLLRSLSGKTIEVMHTDAEGRIVLADALTYAEQYKPMLVVDIATLTGSAMAALGAWANALFTREPVWAKKFRDSSERVGDDVWELPLWDEYEPEIKGTFGDVSNMGKLRGRGGATSAAMFLYQFAKKYPWVHLDIAPMMTALEGQYLAKGATGTGLRVVVDVIRGIAEGT